MPEGAVAAAEQAASLISEAVQPAVHLTGSHLPPLDPADVLKKQDD
jgi:hypothetical protein